MDDIKNRTDEGGKFSLVTNNSDSRDDDEYDEVGIEVKTPLFLQMEMQVWASLPNPSDIVNGHQIPLRRGFKYLYKLYQLKCRMRVVGQTRVSWKEQFQLQIF